MIISFILVARVKHTYNEAHAQPILFDSKIIILTVILMKEFWANGEQVIKNWLSG